MSEVLRRVSSRVASVNGAVANGEPIRVGGNLFDVQIEAEAALVTIQISSDKFAWFTATDIGGVALATIGDSYNAGIREGAQWARQQVASDVGAVRNFDALFIIHKQSD